MSRRNRTLREKGSLTKRDVKNLNIKELQRRLELADQDIKNLWQSNTQMSAALVAAMKENGDKLTIKAFTVAQMQGAKFNINVAEDPAVEGQLPEDRTFTFTYELIPESVAPVADASVATPGTEGNESSALTEDSGEQTIALTGTEASAIP
jgi:hypothetical protein